MITNTVFFRHGYKPLTDYMEMNDLYFQ